MPQLPPDRIDIEPLEEDLPGIVMNIANKDKYRYPPHKLKNVSRTLTHLNTDQIKPESPTFTELIEDNGRANFFERNAKQTGQRASEISLKKNSANITQEAMDRAME